MSAPANPPEDATLEKRPMTQTVGLEIAVRLIGLLIVMTGALYLSGSAAGPGEVPMPAFLLPATVIGAVLITSATLVPRLFEGTMVRPLSDALVVLSVSSFLAVMLYVQPYLLPEELAMLAPTVLLLGGLLAVTSMVKPLSARGGLALRSATLFAAAVLVPLTTPPELLGADLGGFRAWAGLGLLAVALLSLLPLLPRPRDPYVQVAEELVAGDAAVGSAVSGVLLVSLYYAAVRPPLVERSPDLLILSEWTVLGVAALICCALVYSYLKKEGGEAERGSLRRHVPAVPSFKPELQRAAGAVNGFIAEGRPEELVAMMTAVLRANGTAGPEIDKIVQGIERYRAPGKPLRRSERSRDPAAARQDREALVSGMLARAASAVHAEHLTESRGSAVLRREGAMEHGPERVQ